MIRSPFGNDRYSQVSIRRSRFAGLGASAGILVLAAGSLSVDRRSVSSPMSETAQQRPRKSVSWIISDRLLMTALTYAALSMLSFATNPVMQTTTVYRDESRQQQREVPAD
jgi:hypothetical protein